GLINPEAGTARATDALRQLLEGGESQILRRQFGLNISALAGAGGVKLDTLRADPGALLDATKKLVDTLIPPQVTDLSKQLITVRVQKLRDALEQGLSKIGDKGVFDKSVSRLETFGDELFK